MSQIPAFYCDQQSHRGSALFSTPQYLQLSASTYLAGSHRQVEKKLRKYFKKCPLL